MHQMKGHSWKRDMRVVFPSGREKRYSMIQSAVRVAADHARLNHATIEVKSTANDDDARWVELFLNEQRN